MNIPKRQVETLEIIDTECLGLCKAMNKMPGIQTVASCCGHGKDEFCIWFKAKNLEVLPELLYCFDGCHSGCANWFVEVGTDCAMSLVIFLARSSSKGKKAYKEAEIIAQYIEDYVKDKLSQEKNDDEKTKKDISISS